MSWGTSPSSWSSWCSGRRWPCGPTARASPRRWCCVGRRALAGDRALHITLSSGSIKLTAELTLVLVLFTDAARIRISSLRQDIGLPLRLLGIGLPLTVLLGALAAHLFFGSRASGWCTHLGVPGANRRQPGQRIVTNESVPSRVRRALNVESGLNDGIVAPLSHWRSPCSPARRANTAGPSHWHCARS